MGKSILADIAAGGDKSGISAMQADDGDFHDAEGRRWAREGEGDVIMYTILFIFHPLGLLYSPVVLPDVPMNFIRNCFPTANAFEHYFLLFSFSFFAHPPLVLSNSSYHL